MTDFVTKIHNLYYYDQYNIIQCHRKNPIDFNKVLNFIN